MELFSSINAQGPWVRSNVSQFITSSKTNTKKFKDLRWCYLFTTVQSFEISFHLLIL